MAEKKALNSIKWLLVLVLVAAGVWADLHFSSVVWAIKAAVGIVWVIVLLALVYTTSQGHAAWDFIKAARTELRKVVWPTRKETTQVGMVVIAIVIITSLFLWGVDALFLWLISFITGHGG